MIDSCGTVHYAHMSLNNCWQLSHVFTLYNMAAAGLQWSSRFCSCFNIWWLITDTNALYIICILTRAYCKLFWHFVYLHLLIASCSGIFYTYTCWLQVVLASFSRTEVSLLQYGHQQVCDNMSLIVVECLTVCWGVVPRLHMQQ